MKGIRRGKPSHSNPAGTESLYCFDLTFVPRVAVASPYFNNAAVVATATSSDVPAYDAGNDTGCPAPYNDAVARTYAASPSDDRADVGFAIAFM